tara:strand:+ start:1706 stop:2005 length:300 start_codon:yes stop_codon:yes gene_type:complete
MFEIGDRVICVNAKPPEGMNIGIFPNWVKEGKIYTIRGFHDNDDIVVGVLLEEIINPIVPIALINRFQEPAFATWRFNKSDEISIEASIEEEETIEISQ